MDGITIGTILREPPKPGDEICELLKTASVEHIVIPIRNATARVTKWKPNASVSKGTERLHSFALANSSKTSVFVLSNLRVIPAIQTDTVFVEVDPSREGEIDLTGSFVSILLENRPNIKIGIVAPLQTWLSDWEGMLRNLIKANVFACPIIGDGIHSLEALLTGTTQLPAGTVPIVFSISGDDKAKFAEILGRFSANFTEVIFWNPRVMRGIDFMEKEVSMPNMVGFTTVNELVTQYKALQPVARRVVPSRSSLVKGTVEVGGLYLISETQPGTMGETFGLLSSENLWVMLRDGSTQYFEKIS